MSDKNTNNFPSLTLTLTLTLTPEMSHTVYADHTDSFKIIFKIFVRMSSISDAIPNKSLHKARNSSVFSVKIFFKDFVSV